MGYSFFAMLSRMKYIDRWALMRNTESENLDSHSKEVAVIAHALAVIGNARLGKNYNADRAAVLGLFHDSQEIITGDMPTPVKYQNEKILSDQREKSRVGGSLPLSAWVINEIATSAPPGPPRNDNLCCFCVCDLLY